MANLTLVWLAEAAEVAAPVEVAEQFQPYGLDDLREDDAVLAQIGWEQWQELEAYFESHPSARWPGRVVSRGFNLRPVFGGLAGSQNLVGQVVWSHNLREVRYE